LGAGGYVWWKSVAPRVEVVGGFPRVLTRNTPLKVQWSTAFGARTVAVRVEQNGVSTTVLERRAEPNRFLFWREAGRSEEASLTIGRKEIPSLQSGKATIIVEVQSNDWRAKTAQLSKEIPVVLERPAVTPGTEPVFVRRGGTGIVAFTVGGGWSEAGVRVGPYHFPSYPVKGRAERRVCLFAIPPDVDAKADPVLYARNAAGEEAESAFPVRVTAGQFRERTLEMGDRFLDKILGELDAGRDGDVSERFLRINAKMRRANDATLAGLAVKSEPRRLWNGAFVLLPKGKAEARYGDHRTYRIGRKAVSTEWHLGVDMASVKNAPVPAGNDGKVVYAGKLGIYGNVVAVDHGLSVQSVYAHLSSSDVRVGEAVKRGQTIGKSGMTGMAGGDHLHMGIMIAGVFADPVEWSFASWMEKTMMPLAGTLE
jgi:murein DD-endopeptidase MepM/ murein hydrolase activator NlpD